MKRTPLVLLLLSLAIWGCMPTEPSTQSTPKVSDTLAPVVAKDTVFPEVRESLDSLLAPISVGWWQPLHDISVLFDPSKMTEPSVDTSFPVDCEPPGWGCKISKEGLKTTLTWDYPYMGGSATYFASPSLDSILDSAVSPSERVRLASTLSLLHRIDHRSSGQGGAYSADELIRTSSDGSIYERVINVFGRDFSSDSVQLGKVLGASGWLWTFWSRKKSVTSASEIVSFDAFGGPFLPTGAGATGSADAFWRKSDYTFTKATLRFAPDSEFVEALEGRDNSGYDSVWMAGTKSDSIRWTTFAKKGDTTRLAWHRPDLRHVRMDSLYVHKNGLSSGRWKEYTVIFRWDTTIANPLDVGVVSKIRFEGVRQTGEQDKIEGRVLLMTSENERRWLEVRNLSKN